MPNEKDLTTMQISQPRSRPPALGCLSARRYRPAIVKSVAIVPLTMAMLGAEIELRLSPQLDVLLTTAGVWGLWAWLKSRTPPIN